MRGPGPACVRCERLMKPKTVGALLEEFTEKGEPYKLWACDIWFCPGCGFEVVWGYGNGPLEHAWEIERYENLKVSWMVKPIVRAK